MQTGIENLKTKNKHSDYWMWLWKRQLCLKKQMKKQLTDEVNAIEPIRINKSNVNIVNINKIKQQKNLSLFHDTPLIIIVSIWSDEKTFKCVYFK